MPERRFRDMSLTERDVQTLGYWTMREGKNPHHWNLREKRKYWKFEARAKRLLPLWRAVGLKRLKDEGRAEGYVCGVDDARFGRF